ncbi:unnamed protein product [Rhizophagus irregularis]|uniref:Uncharacterized protein n=1 Tax=Rhizophagus irregularis TaxID=588596 RepID=A0A915YZS4_9GLOM|nr:unnamed protein product [Rhizophagus irregularis]
MKKLLYRKEDEKLLNILVTIFVNSINYGDEYYQTAINLFCFIEENNKDPTDILKLYYLTQAIEHHSCIIVLLDYVTYVVMELSWIKLMRLTFSKYLLKMVIQWVIIFLDNVTK